MDEQKAASPAPRRSRGRPKRSTIESLRAALAFSTLKAESGLSWSALERAYIQDTNPERFHMMVRKPDAFLRYVNGQQIPKGMEYEGSPVRWAAEHYPGFRRAYESPLFDALLLENDIETLSRFTRDVLWRQARLSRDVAHKTMRKVDLGIRLRFSMPVWYSPGDIVEIRSLVDLDALCLILISLKSNLNQPRERPCLLVCAEWLQAWIRLSQPNMKLKNLMLQALAEHIPALARLFVSSPPWDTLKVDFTDECFEQFKSPWPVPDLPPDLSSV